MNSNTKALTFEETTFKPVQRRGQVWLTLPEIAAVLYREGGDQSGPPSANEIRQVQKLYQRHADEFSASMTALVSRTTAGGKQMVRVFSLRGAHLLAMFARTEVAKRFRRWVLDILDREVAAMRAEANAGPRLDDGMKQNLDGLCSHVEFLRSWWGEFGPAIRGLSPDVAARIHDHFVDGVCFARNIARSAGINLDSRIRTYPWRADSHIRSQHMSRRVAA